MTRAAGEAFQALRPGQRTLLYCRSSIIGAHRWGGIWLGDNHSSWSQLLANIQMMPAVQMCGFLYSGADLCGFSEDTTPDLALRWLEFGLFTPLMRNHADAASRKQEFYRFADLLPAIRNMLGLRYALLPYLYSEFMKAALEDAPYFRPLAFDYPADSDAREVEDQLLLGDGLMIAPIYTQNAHGRTVGLCPTGCTPMTASPPTPISPTTGASSGNKNPRTQPSALPLLQRDAAKLLRHGATKSS